MKAYFLFTILTVFLAYGSFSYSLEGRWNVRSQYLLDKTQASISFDKQIDEVNSRIQYFMNIFACKLIRYKYIVMDNELFLTFDSEVTQRYQCKPDEISSIRSKVEKSFYFLIIGTELTLYGANNQPQMKLLRVIPESKNLVGQWVTVDVNGKKISEEVSISESKFELCGGNGVVSYSIQSASSPVINFKVEKTNGCVQNEIYSTLIKSKYYRWKGSVFLYLYNSQFEEIMAIRRIGDKLSIPDSQPISPSSVDKKVTQSTTTSVNTITQTPKKDTANTAISSSSKNIDQVKAQSSVNPPTSNSVQTNNNYHPSQTAPTPSVQTKTQNKASNVVTNPTNTQTNQQKSDTQITQTNSFNIVKYSSVSDLPQLTKNDFLGKWIIKDTNFDFTSGGFFFLVLNDKIMLYGACNVYFSIYSLNQSTLNNISVQNTTKICPQLSGQVKSLIEKFKSWKYVAIKQQNGKINLQILDKTFVHLNNLQKL